MRSLFSFYFNSAMVTKLTIGDLTNGSRTCPEFVSTDGEDSVTTFNFGIHY